MKKIEIELNQDYKSFKNGFSPTLEGDLIILSGINGAGKSQLMNILQGFDKSSRQNIHSKINIDEVLISIEDIDFRSFKENIGITEIGPASSQVLFSSADQAWENFVNIIGLDRSEFIESILEAKEILVKNHSLDEYNSKTIKEQVFKKTLRDANFIWRRGDKFSNIIGEIFFIHALKVNEEMVEVGREKFDSKTIDEAPWIKLNKLFDSLNFDYRFKDNYELKGVEINEQPKLYAIKNDGTIDEDDSRNLFDLSDGEKTIISLCFATLIDNKRDRKKLLLLDEIDSVLNPSLIQIFFKVIEEFFIKQNRLVILSTHSPATISLCPPYAKFYEVFKPNSTGNRILEISPNEYSELLIANKKFYDKISNQESRILELQKNIASDNDILIVTEGKTDWKYFLSALRFFHENREFLNIKDEYFYKFGSENDLREKICGTENVNDLSESKLKNYLNFLIEGRRIDVHNKQIRIGIFDSDKNISLINDSQKNIYSFKIEPNNISTELLFNDDEIKTLIESRRLFIGDEFGDRNKINIINSSLTLGGDPSNTNKAGKRTIIETDVYNREGENVALSKERFSQAVFQKEIDISNNSWENFRKIFSQISNIINENIKEEIKG